MYEPNCHTPNPPLQLGETVFLASGSPPLTIIGLDSDKDGQIHVWCKWCSDCGELYDGTFVADILRRTQHPTWKMKPSEAPEICLSGSAVIITEHGPCEIKNVSRKFKVLSFNHSAGVAEWQAVEADEESAGRPLMRIKTGYMRTLELTEYHPVCVVSNGISYVRADKLRQRDQVICATDERKTQDNYRATGLPIQISVDNIDVISAVAVVPDKVYNLKVAGNHNYFANGILVHNC